MAKFPDCGVKCYENTDFSLCRKRKEKKNSPSTKDPM